MRPSTLNRYLLRIAGIGLFIIFWEFLSLQVGERSFIFPGPLETLRYTLRLLEGSYVYKCIFQTMSRMVLGFAVSFLLALVLGVLAGNSSTVEELLKPGISVLKSIPTACLVYLFLVLAGARMTPMYIVILIAFPILYESVLAGMKSVPEEIVKAASLDGADYLTCTMKIKLPTARPYIIAGIASTVALSFKIEIMAEVITGYTRSGLGSAILAAQRSDPTNMVPVFAYGLVVIILVEIFDFVALLLKD